MHASFSMTARAVARGLNQSGVIAACFALTDRCHARQSKQNVHAMPAMSCCAAKIMPDKVFPVSQDWVGNARTNILAWWIPKSAILIALFAPVPVRAAVWSVALVWMGVACILNVRRCGRTHCRYTGPFYLAMIVPVSFLASGIVSANLYGWLALALFILPGGWIIWWATEQVWGKFS